jgi:BASS family bile acid:Na+ symporter
MDQQLLLNFVQVTIFTLMLTIGIKVSWSEMLSLWRKPRLLLRVLLAVVILVPLVVILLLNLFDLPTGVASGLAVLAASPGAPLMTKRAVMVGASFSYAASLQLTLALTAVFITPITLAIFYALFELEIEKVSVLQVSQQVAMVQLIPLILGLLLQKFRPKIAQVIAKPIGLLGNVLFVLLLILLIVPAFRLKVQISILAMVVIVIMVVSTLAIGHLLGGSEVEKRSALAISTIARNLGLAVFIVVLSETQNLVFPTLTAYAILGAIVVLPYSLWIKRQLSQT